MSQTSTIKSITEELLSEYNSATSLIGKKYSGLIKNLEEGYDDSKKKISEAAKESRDKASAEYMINRANSKKSLLKKGLSRSGESLQSEVMDNLAYQNNLRSINKNENDSLTALEKEKNQGINSLESEKAEKELEAKNNYVKAYTEQFNKDRDYEYKKAQDAEVNSQNWAKINQAKIDSDRNYELSNKDLEIKKSNNALGYSQLALDREKMEISKTSISKEVKEFVEGVVDRYTLEDHWNNTKIINYNNVVQALEKVIKGGDISEQMKNQLNIYINAYKSRL